MEPLDRNTWKQLEPETRVIADFVVLTFLFWNGRRVKTEGKLYLLKTVQLDSYWKVDTYVQHVSGSNNLLAFDIRLPLFQDITRFCTRTSKALARESRWHPVLLGALIYATMLNIWQYSPALGIYIDLFAPVPLSLNVFAITSLGWWAYVDLRMTAYKAAFEEDTSYRMQLNLDIKKKIGAKVTHLVHVRRYIEVIVAKIFYSEMSHLEVLSYNKKDIETDLVKIFKAKFEDNQYELALTEEKYDNLETRYNQVVSQMEDYKQGIRRVAREYFLKGSKSIHSPIFQEKSPLAFLNEEWFWRNAIVAMILVALTVIGIPFVKDTEWGIPDIPLWFQVGLLCAWITFIVIILAALYKSLRSAL